jgi:hypothetical protein
VSFLILIVPRLLLRASEFCGVEAFNSTRTLALSKAEASR